MRAGGDPRFRREDLMDLTDGTADRLWTLSANTLFSQQGADRSNRDHRTGATRCDGPRRRLRLVLPMVHPCGGPAVTRGTPDLTRRNGDIPQRGWPLNGRFGDPKDHGNSRATDRLSGLVAGPPPVGSVAGAWIGAPANDGRYSRRCARLLRGWVGRETGWPAARGNRRLHRPERRTGSDRPVNPNGAEAERTARSAKREAPARKRRQIGNDPAAPGVDSGDAVRDTGSDSMSGMEGRFGGSPDPADGESRSAADTGADAWAG